MPDKSACCNLCRMTHGACTLICSDLWSCCKLQSRRDQSCWRSRFWMAIGESTEYCYSSLHNAALSIILNKWFLSCFVDGVYCWSCRQPYCHGLVDFFWKQIHHLSLNSPKAIFCTGWMCWPPVMGKDLSHKCQVIECHCSSTCSRSWWMCWEMDSVWRSFLESGKHSAASSHISCLLEWLLGNFEKFSLQMRMDHLDNLHDLMYVINTTLCPFTANGEYY